MRDNDGITVIIRLLLRAAACLRRTNMHHPAPRLVRCATGIRAGGRTGLTAMTVAALFLCCLFFEPLFASIPGFAAAPALVFVAAGFLAPLGQLDWDDLASAVPVMLMAILMPLTFSIAAGIAVGFLAFCAIMLISGRGAEINAGTWVITAFGGLWLAAPLFGG